MPFFPHLGHRFGQGQSLGAVAVDLDDPVVGLEPRLPGRGVLDRRNDREHVVLHADLDAQASELAARVDLHVLEDLGREEVGMRIEGFEHPLDGPVDQVLVLDGIHVVGLHEVEHLLEKLDILVTIVLLGAGRRRTDDGVVGRPGPDPASIRN